MKIAIKSSSIGTVFAELTDENPKTAKAINDLLPLSGPASLWGEEIYFSINPVIASPEGTRQSQYSSSLKGDTQTKHPSPLRYVSSVVERMGEGKGEGDKQKGFQLAIAPEHPRTVVKAGEIAIWIEQPSFCIIFGKTPMSTDKEIRVYSECNVIGKVEGNPKIFKKVKEGEKITVSKAPESKIDGEGFVNWLSTSG